MEKHTINKYGEVLSEPIDVELGTLYYMINHGELLGISKEEQERILFLRVCRNTIAHVECCMQERVKKAIDGKTYLE